MLNFTRFGRYVYMTGGNREAAEYSGINTKMIIASVMVISAVCAGLAGMLGVAHFGSAQQDEFDNYLLDSISAVVVGGMLLAPLTTQPWHLYSGVVTRCVIAASTLPSGKAAAKAALEAVAAHREEFEFARHAGGPNMDVTPSQIIARLEGYSGLKLAEAFAIPDLDREIKWHCKYARQNGVHVSPTFMIDGLIRNDMGSGDAVADWVSRILAG